MGLWGSKQTKEFTTTNPKPSDTSEIYITKNALDNVLFEANAKAEAAERNVPVQVNTKESPEESDKRIKEYEEKIFLSLNASTRNVENLFNDRYVEYDFFCLLN
jgi:hypothetical protein